MKVGMLKILVAMLLSLAPAKRDTETWAQREVRMTTIAVVLDDVGDRATCQGKYAKKDDCKRIWPGSKRDLVYFLAMTGRREANFAQNVHEGRCEKNECDSYTVNGVTFFRAHSVWQIHDGGIVSHDVWEKMVGTDAEATWYGAWAATRIFSASVKLCHGGLQCAIGVYAGRGGNWPEAVDRFKEFQKLEATSVEEFEATASRRREKAFCRENPDILDCMCKRDPTGDACVKDDEIARLSAEMM